MVTLRPMGDGGQLLAVHATERAAGGREKNLVDTVLADEALEDGRVLAVDRQNRYPMAQSGGGDDAAGHHHGLLVGQSNSMAMLDGTEGGTQTRETHDGRQNKVDGGHLHEVGNGGLSCVYFDTVGLKGVADKLVFALVGNGYRIGVELHSLLNEQVGIATGTKHFDDKAVAVMSDDIECLGADGTCGA